MKYFVEENSNKGIITEIIVEKVGSSEIISLDKL